MATNTSLEKWSLNQKLKPVYVGSSFQGYRPDFQMDCCTFFIQQDIQKSTDRTLDWMISKDFKLLYVYTWQLYNIWEIDLALNNFITTGMFLSPLV